MSISSRLRGPACGATLAFALAFAPGQASAQLAVACVNCATSYTQLQSFAKEAQSVAQQVQQYQLQLQQYQNMVTNTVGLPIQLWNQAQGTIMRVQALSNTSTFLGGQSSSLLSRLNGIQSYGSQLSSLGGIADQYSYWNRSAGNQLTQNLSTLGFNEQQSQSDAALLAQLQAHSQSASGQVQALQAGNEMASFTGAQLLRIQSMLNAGMTLTAARMAIDADRQAAQDARSANFNADPALATTGYGRF